ncbi:response regulator transcription factor [Pseudoclavibacter chungangensis]|uniref:Response regulator transcription factor n=1 Tax=Pseudoclavibacter chungangensis TaxID=587635 RepID=A0A7J5BMH8_9MICO|nr:response regulator transcription factor [Pseudoclavibacter chungangensis]KAB1652733.1 response regulator transcription factor [Pseudoclavibacter chungangensis]NYJ68008.1 DNA-binding NarL/FixJ family response regulator [Pseudoclavibacter chungangensis]
MIRVLLADDHATVRSGVRLLLERAGDIEVVGEAADGAAAIGDARALRPDVVLMDARMPGIDGIEATAAITARRLAAVLVLTTYDLDEVVFGVLRAGAAGILLKTVEPDVLIDAVRRVAAGDGVMAPEVTRRVLEHFVVAPGGRSGGIVDPAEAEARADADRAPSFRLDDSSVAGLTPREREVLGVLGRGLSNAGIARTLGVTEATAKTHVSRILTKLGLVSRMQAAIAARELGLDR